jgi:hypothetical protein
MEPVFAALSTFGLISLVASWVLLLIVAFRTDYVWGLATLFVPPLSYLYALFALDKAGSAIFFAFLGMILLFFGL